MLKPFAVSRRECYTLAVWLLAQPSENKEERQKRKQFWKESALEELKRRLMAVLTIEEQKAEIDATKADPGYLHPKKAYLVQYVDDAHDVRVELSQTTVNYLIDKLSGKLEGATGEVLGELCDRLIALRDTNEDAVCTEGGTGYRLPRELWTKEEIAAAMAARPPQTLEDGAVG